MIHFLKRLFCLNLLFFLCILGRNSVCRILIHVISILPIEEVIMIKKIMPLIILSILLSISLQAQTSDGIDEWLDELSNYSGTYLDANVRGYCTPLADAFGASVSSGLFRSAKISTFGLHFYVGVSSMGAFMSDDQTMFTARFPGVDLNNPLDDQYVTGTPTLFGNSSGKIIRVDTPSGRHTVKIQGIGFKFFPMVAPHITVGNFLGTQLSLRWMDFKLNDDLGQFRLFGYGFQHSISQYFLLSPIDLSFGFFIHKFDIEADIAKLTLQTSYFGLQASKSFAMLTVYGGIGTELSSLRLQFSPSQLNQPIDLTITGKNGSRMNAGIGLSLAIVKINVDYNIGAQKTVAMGVGLGF